MNIKNLYFITNKRIKWLEDYLKIAAPDAHVLYSCVAYERDHQYLRIREHEDGELYMFGKPLRHEDQDYMDCHELYDEIPAGKYIYINKAWMLEHPSQQIELNDDMIIVAIPDENDITSYLAIGMYLKNKGYKPSRKIYCLQNNDPEQIKGNLIDFLSETLILPFFESELAREIEKKRETNFESSFPMTRNFGYLLIESGMDNTEFANYFGMSVRNVENWKHDPSTLKNYLYDLFEYKLLKEGII